MKTTLEIPDPIFRRAKSVAAERGDPADGPLRGGAATGRADIRRANAGSALGKRPPRREENYRGR